MDRGVMGMACENLRSLTITWRTNGNIIGFGALAASSKTEWKIH
jgi:hypothetical protein